MKDFRNYAEADVSLLSGANVFVGRNGQGKTNLVEAVAYLATLGSHRVSSDAPLVRDGTEAAIVRARLAHGERTVLLELQLNRQGANRARVNGVNVRTSELPRYAQVVRSLPRTSRSSAATPRLGAGSRTNWSCSARRAWPRCSPITTASSVSVARC